MGAHARLRRSIARLNRREHVGQPAAAIVDVFLGETRDAADAVHGLIVDHGFPPAAAQDIKASAFADLLETIRTAETRLRPPRPDLTGQLRVLVTDVFHGRLTELATDPEAGVRRRVG